MTVTHLPEARVIALTGDRKIGRLVRSFALIVITTLGLGLAVAAPAGAVTVLNANLNGSVVCNAGFHTMEVSVDSNAAMASARVWVYDYSAKAWASPTGWYPLSGNGYEIIDTWNYNNPANLYVVVEYAVRDSNGTWQPSAYDWINTYYEYSDGGYGTNQQSYCAV